MFKRSFFVILSFCFVFSVSAQEKFFDESVEEIMYSMKYSKERKIPYTRSVEVCNSEQGNIETINTLVGGACAKLNIHFDFNSSVIKNTSKPQAKIAGIAIKTMHSDYIKDGKKFDTVYIKGYADSTGTEIYNKNLSFKRALSVKKYLRQNFKELGNINLVCYGYGESFLVVENEQNDLDRQKNRRVEISLNK